MEAKEPYVEETEDERTAIKVIVESQNLMQKTRNYGKRPIRTKVENFNSANSYNMLL